MSGSGAEKLFKFIFGFAIFLAILLVIGLFLLLLKIILLFTPALHIMGLTITQ